MPERPDLDFLFVILMTVGFPVMVAFWWIYDGVSQVVDFVKWAWRKIRGK